MNKKLILVTIVVALIAFGFIYENNKSRHTAEKQETKTQDSSGKNTSANTPDQLATDYSTPNHWLNLPSVIDKKVDVFYLYPTAWQSDDQTNSHIAAIDNPSMLENAPKAFARQATAFEPVGNIYAPYYRQNNMSPTDREKVVAGIPTTDATAAFDYYIKHYNNGRPFILAGHSQGSNVLINLLSGYLKENPEVYKKMIVAYVIGYSVTDDYLAQNPHLKFAEGAGDTGVIVSYNTEAPTVDGNNFVVLPGALAINPITWTRDETLATAAQNLGSIMINQDGSPVLDANGKIESVKNFADAKVDKTKGVVICSTVDVNKYSPGNASFPKGVYHSFDYPFYYFNLRENAAKRTENFLNK